jgi:ABC-2 type transport system ATP-binding protein
MKGTTTFGQNAVTLRGISKKFHVHTWKTIVFRQNPQCVNALKDVSLSVKTGEVMGLLGPNGAGKTTLIKILASLITPDRGAGSILGERLEGDSLSLRSRIGVVLNNDRSFYWRLSGRENLDFFAALHGFYGREKKRRVNRMLHFVDLMEKADTPFMNYSAGQKQRLAIARAMLPEPELLLMDEVASSLDPVAADRLTTFTRDDLASRQKKTVIWCTHNLQEAAKVCDRVTILHRGKTIKTGTPDELTRGIAQTSRYRLVLDRVPDMLADRLEKKPSTGRRNPDTVVCTVRIPPATVPDIIKELAVQGIKLHECTPVTPSIEDAFRLLVEKEEGN